MLNILYFARLKETLGRDAERIDLPAGDRTHRRVAAVLLYLGDSGSAPATAGPVA